MGIEFRYEGLREMIERIEAVGRQPTPEQRTAMEAVARSAFEASQAEVHIESGQLRASGEFEAQHGPHTVEATLSWGSGDRHSFWAARMEISRGGEHAAFWDNLTDGRWDEPFIDAALEAGPE